MSPISWNNLIELSGGITAIGGAIHVIQRILAKFKEKKDKEKQEILQLAYQEVDQVRAKLEAKLRSFEVELENQKESVNKDLSHMRETYNAEIKALGDKIENLRSDLSMQHQSLVALLTRLIDTK